MQQFTISKSLQFLFCLGDLLNLSAMFTEGINDTFADLGDTFADDDDVVADDQQDEMSLDDEVTTVVPSNIELLALLKKNNYIGFKKKLDLPTDLEDNDDLDVMVKLMTSKGNGQSGAKTLFKNLFNVLCCLAGESVDKVVMSSSQILINFNTQFLFWYENIEEKEEFSSGLLRHFPDKKMPLAFRTYVETLQVAPTQRWNKANGVVDLSAPQQKCAKFGSIVKNHFDTCKKEINGNANPLWIAPSNLPSGVSKYAYTYFIRKQLWPVRAMELAKKAAKAANTRMRRKGETLSDVDAAGARTAQYHW
jgi:hypothetical protein